MYAFPAVITVELVFHVLMLGVLVALLLCLFMFLKKLGSAKKAECECCSASGHPGEYRLAPEEQLVAMSYPGPPPAGPSVNLDLAHELPLPELLPIITVTNRTGSLDVVVETWPNEHWYGAGGVPAQPEQQPQPQVCNEDNLTSAKVFPEEGQPGIDRVPLGLEIPKVEARPIYFVRLEAGQSTTVYAAPPGGWIRLRALGQGASGSYCVSWCCPPEVVKEKESQKPPPTPPHDVPPPEPGGGEVPERS